MVEVEVIAVTAVVLNELISLLERGTLEGAEILVECRGVARISGRGVLKIFPLLRLPLMRVRVQEWVGSLLSAALAHAKHCRIAVPTILSAGKERYAVAAC